MAKANIILPDGTKVTIEGTPDEVATLLTRFSGSGGNRKGPQGLIAELAQEDYFKSKRELLPIRWTDSASI